jgi:hypothetical protein
MMNSHLVKHLTVVSFLLLAACKREEPLSLKQQITRDDAVRIVREKMLLPDSLNKAIYGWRNLLPKSEAVSVSGNTNKLHRVEYESCFFFIDDEYLIQNWPHDCRYVFINANDGSYEAFDDRYLPERFSEMDTVFIWARPQTKSLPPLTFQDQSRGCGNIRVYKLNQEYTAAIVVEADTAKLHLSREMKTFDLGNKREGLQVYIDFYFYLPEGNGFIRQLYCNDVASYHQPPKKWVAQRGEVQITLGEPVPPGIGYKATVRLENVHFVDENGQNEIVLSQLIFNDVFVGWLPG